ncbi:MAG: hypothetical protein JWP25_5019, partial [Bradyrhizobium sp.]|nr:hypothetical protein [Bradyrhizobium sp.]
LGYKPARKPSAPRFLTPEELSR